MNLVFFNEPFCLFSHFSYVSFGFCVPGLTFSSRMGSHASTSHCITHAKEMVPPTLGSNQPLDTNTTTK